MSIPVIIMMQDIESIGVRMGRIYAVLRSKSLFRHFNWVDIRIDKAVE
jgi:hypothetical protein